MKQTKHKITDVIQRRIYDTASKLPMVGKVVNGKPVYKIVQVPGTMVKKEDLAPGTPIILNATYRIKQLEYENHVMNMIRLVQRDGEVAIDNYKNAIEAQVAAYKRADAAEKSVSNKILKTINKSISWLKKKISR